MKRIVIAVIVGLVVFGGTFAFAASLGGINTGSIGDSATVVASCDTDGVDASFASPSWDTAPGTPDYGVGQLDLSNIDTACAGDTIKVTLMDSGGASLGEATTTMAASPATTASVTFSPKVSAASVEHIEVVIAS